MPDHSDDIPRRIHTYRGAITDSSRWEAFVHRDDDVFVCTPPKSGTTWMQAISAMLIFGTPELDFNPGDRALWLDAMFTPLDAMRAHFEAQTERRVVKTHTPLDGMPFFEGCTYLAVYRDPRDVFFSMLNHYDNMTRDVALEVRALPPEQAFVAWMETEYRPDHADAFALSRVTHHFSSFWRHRQLPNVHLFHYADLRRDLPAGMAAVARALGIEAGEDLLATLADAASFDRMKQQPARFVPGAGNGFWRDPGRFLNRGQSGQFRGVLSEASLAAYETRLRGLLPEDQAAWLTHGTAAGSAPEKDE